MINKWITRFKAWVASIAREASLIAAREEVFALSADYKQKLEDHIKDVFLVEVAKLADAAKAQENALASTAHIVKEDARNVLAQIKESEAAKLEGIINERVEAKLMEFEAQLRRSYEQGKKESPSEWKADAVDVKADHQLRHPVKRRK